MAFSVPVFDGILSLSVPVFPWQTSVTVISPCYSQYISSILFVLDVGISLCEAIPFLMYTARNVCIYMCVQICVMIYAIYGKLKSCNRAVFLFCGLVILFL